MGDVETTRAALEQEIQELRAQLAESQDTLRAIREGEVDALVVSAPDGLQVFTMRGADRTYQTMLEQLQEGALNLLEDGWISYSNQSFAKTVKLPLEQIIGSHIREHVVESDHDHLRQLIRQSLGGWARGELTLQASDGTLVPIHVSLGETVLDGLSSICMAVTDLTELKQAEERRRASEAHYRSILDAANGFAYCRMLFVEGQPHDFTYLEVNRAFETLTGLKDVVGKNVTEVIPGIHQTDLQLFEIFGRVAWTGSPEKFEYYLKSLDRWFSISVFSPRTEYFVAVFDDITDRKRAEAERREINRQLEAATARANDMGAKAELATRAKSEFLANMSHEIRTPMTAILGYAELLMERQVDHATQVHHVAVIKRSGEQLLELINDILDLSKVEAGKLQIAPIRCSPGKLVAEIVSFMRVRAAEKQLNLQTELAGPLPATVLTDPLRLRQVLINLLGNAIKFTDRGKIRLTVQLVSDGGPPLLRFDVTDTGIGINAEQIGQLFQAFTQVDSSAVRKFGGTGLGLCISKHLAQALGGDLEVRSQPGQGSTFSVTIDPGPLAGIRLLSEGVEAALPAAPCGAPAGTG